MLPTHLPHDPVPTSNSMHTGYGAAAVVCRTLQVCTVCYCAEAVRDPVLSNNSPKLTPPTSTATHAGPAACELVPKRNMSSALRLAQALQHDNGLFSSIATRCDASVLCYCAPDHAGGIRGADAANTDTLKPAKASEVWSLQLLPRGQRFFAPVTWPLGCPQVRLLLCCDVWLQAGRPFKPFITRWCSSCALSRRWGHDPTTSLPPVSMHTAALLA
jgi:hypothetical protein